MNEQANGLGCNPVIAADLASEAGQDLQPKAANPIGNINHFIV